MSSSRRYNIVLWGATGFTGQLASEYLAKKYVESLESDEKFTFAIAGRNESKLTSVASEVAKVYPEAKFDVLVGDIADMQSLDRITAQTDVLCSCAGPYKKFGTPVVESCVRNGTHYCDITGETLWIKEIIDKYHRLAIENRTVIVPSCGFDSVPSDMGVYAASKLAREKYPGTNLTSVTSCVTASGGSVSGGTIHSALGMAGDSEAMKAGKQVYYLNLENDEAKPRTSKAKDGDSDLRFPEYNNRLRRWLMFNPLAFPNKRTVHRSESLWNSVKKGYGPQFRFREGASFGNVIVTYVLSFFMAITALLIQFPIMRRVFKYVLPQPGDGPTKEQREASRFSVTILANINAPEAKGAPVAVRVNGTDPGYTDTSRFVIEAALTLLSKKKANSFQDFNGGILTPSTALGDDYLARLSAIGLGFNEVTLKN